MSELRIENRSERDQIFAAVVKLQIKLSAVHSYDLYHIHFTRLQLRTRTLAVVPGCLFSELSENLDTRDFLTRCL